MTSFVLRWFRPVVNNAAKLIYAFEKKRLLTSQLRVSSTQITRYKSRKTGGLDAFDSQHLGKYADDLLHLLEKRRDPLEKEIKKWKNDLSGVLFQYSQRGEEPLLLALFRKMTDLGQANEASYTILMRYYADCDDYDKVKYYFEHMENSGVLYHGRSYVPLIVLSLKMNKLDETELYFNQLLQNSRKMFVHNAFVDIIDACADLREETGAKDEFTKRLVDQALHMMERYGSEPLEIDATETLLKWFNSSPSKQWKINEVHIESDVKTCPCCGGNIKKNELPLKRLVRLKRNLMAYVESTIALKANTRIADVDRKRRNTKIRDVIQRRADHYGFFDTLVSNNSGAGLRGIASTKCTVAGNEAIFSVLGRLEEYLDSEGPFDVVIDALNIGYYTKGFNPLQVRDVANVFKDRRCLVLCAGILKEKLLTQDPVPRANLRLKGLLLHLKKVHNIFFVGSSVLDDYYILYTLLYHDFNIQLVTRDLLRDHLYHLDSASRVDFQRWQTSNQFVLQSFTTDNEPIFSEQMDIKVSVQNSEVGWHIPRSPNKWLCVHKPTVKLKYA